MRDEPDDLDKILESSKKEGLLTREEEVILTRKAHAGDIDARNELVSRNMLFVKKVVNDFIRMGITIPEDDLFQEGCLGLIEAAHKFDPDKGFKFISFAVWDIRKNILAYIRRNRTSFKMPINSALSKRALNLAREQYREEFGRMPTDDVIAKRLGVELSQVLDADQFAFDAISLDGLITTKKGDADDSLYSFLPASEMDLEDEYAEHDERMRKKQTVDDAIQVLMNLYPRNTKIACQHFGLGDFSEPTTLEEVAKVHQLTRERVRQVSKKWMYRLRYYLKFGKLPIGVREARKVKTKKAQRENMF